MGKGGLFFTVYSFITVMTWNQGLIPLPPERALGVPWVSGTTCSHRDQGAGRLLRARAHGESCPQERELALRERTRTKIGTWLALVLNGFWDGVSIPS